MNLPRTEEFLEEVVSHVRFKFDRSEIKSELEGHILDKIDYYLEEGYGG